MLEVENVFFWYICVHLTLKVYFMNDWESIKDKGNVWKLVYASFVAVENAPSECYGCSIDEDGNEYDSFINYSPDEIRVCIKNIELKDIEFKHLKFSDALGAFVEDCKKGKVKFPFTYEAYLQSEDIINTIKAFGLNVEQFWYAIIFIYWLTEIRCVNVIKLYKTVGEQIKELSNYLRDVDSFTIISEGKKKLTINDVITIGEICNFLDEKLVKNEEIGMNNGYSFKLNSERKELMSLSVQMWFSATRYSQLFENLGLAPKQKSNNESVSLNKMLFISRLMFFTRLTDNKNFLYSDESLKSIVKQYKNYSLNTHNPEYVF